MAEKDVIFSSGVKYNGIFNFSELYQFAYDWLVEETDIENLIETKYAEKLVGDAKNIDVIWEGHRELTDYFRFDIKVTFKIIMLKKVEINKNGQKIQTNTGDCKITIKGTLVRDYKGKFEKTGFMKFLRSIYEKWVIASRVDQFEGKIASDSDDFLKQMKAFLDLEGQR